MAVKPDNLIQSDVPFKIVQLARPVRLKKETVEIKCDLSVIDFAVATAPQIAAAALNANTNCMAAAVASAIGQERGGLTEQAVYAVAAETNNRVKIGIASNPYVRLSDLQVCHWERLYVAGLLWVYGNALNVEQLALKVAKKSGLWMIGEWVKCDPDTAMEIVANAAMTLGEVVADSALWLNNRMALMQARRKAGFELSAPQRLGFKRMRFDQIDLVTPIN